MLHCSKLQLPAPRRWGPWETLGWLTAQVELQTVLAQKQATQRMEVLRSTQLADAAVMAESKVRFCNTTHLLSMTHRSLSLPIGNPTMHDAVQHLSRRCCTRPTRDRGWLADTHATRLARTSRAPSVAARLA